MSQTILYVEDNAGNALMIQLVLKREGYTVILAEDGDIGLELANKHKPDLIICDYHLPGPIKGPQFVQTVRRTPSIANTPIIMLTADTTAYPESMGSGSDLFVNKPIDRDILLNSIHSLVSYR